MSRFRILCLLGSLALGVSVAHARPADKSKFLQFEDQGKETGELKTSIVTYRNKEGVEVSLISAVHVGDKKYYDDLEADFRRYDSLLYEMIKPEGVSPSAGGKKEGGSIISVSREG